MASITDQVIKLQELTQQNLDILQAINESFFTKKNHLYASIGDNMFAIPSFMSLENKINLLISLEYKYEKIYGIRRYEQSELL